MIEYLEKCHSKTATALDNANARIEYLHTVLSDSDPMTKLIEGNKTALASNEQLLNQVRVLELRYQAACDANEQQAQRNDRLYIRLTDTKDQVLKLNQELKSVGSYISKV